MALPQIAIVGRPNVGKSSLFNRLVGRRVSIVDAAPGVTRDRVSAILEIDPPTETPKGTPSCVVEIMDTGGYGVYVAEGRRYNDVGADLADLTPDIEQQIGVAMDRADVIMLIIDAQVGLTPLDETIATLLRERGARDRLLLVANKVDGESWEAHGLEAASLGFGEPVAVSATSGYGVRRLLATLFDRIEAIAPTEPDAATEPEMKLAIVGKRNSGKSTLINTLAGEPRVIVSEIAGTTRDSVDVRFEIDGRRMLAIDTAGLRRRRSFEDDIEYYAYHRMLQSIRRADVVLLLIDATEEISQVDQKLAQELQRQYKPTVIVINKWDLIDPAKTQPESYLEYLTQELRGLDFAPLAFVSAEKHEGVHDLVAMAFNLFQQARHREPTGSVNRIVEDIMKKRGPSSRLGTQARVFYATQVAIEPPTLVIVVNDPRLFKGRYERYLLNRLREELPFSEVPIRLIFRRRERVSLESLKAQGRQAARDRH